MTTVAMRRDIEDGAPIVIVPTQHRVVHLPARDRRPAHVGAPVTLDEVLEAGGSPSSWRTLCGDRGGVFVYGSVFWTTRTPCAKCLRAAAEPQVEPERAPDTCQFCLDTGVADDGSPRCPVCRKEAAR